MAAPSAAPINAGGRWVLNPTNFGAAYPHDGTELGLTHGVEVETEEFWAPIAASEYGGRVVNRVFQGAVVFVTLTLVNWDPAALAVWRPGVTTGGSGKPIVPLDAASYAHGSLQSTRGVNLVHVARHATDPSFRIYNAVPTGDPVRIPFQDSLSVAMQITFEGLMNSSEELATLRALADM